MLSQVLFEFAQHMLMEKYHFLQVFYGYDIHIYMNMIYEWERIM